jgi:hypothetical protein
MSWVSENKFLTGFGVVMLAGLGTLGTLTYLAMAKYDTSASTFDSAAAQLKRLRETKPALTKPHLDELTAQKQELAVKIGNFQKELKDRVLPLSADPIKPAQFQDKLKDAVAQVAAKAAEAKVELPKNFYLGFEKYQSKPPKDTTATALARQLHAIELVMDALIRTGKNDALELNELTRNPLPEEDTAKRDDGRGGERRRNAGDGADHGMIERVGLSIKITSNEDALHKLMTRLANHEQQLFIIRKVSVQNKQSDSPQRMAGGPPIPLAPATPAPDAAPPAEKPATATPDAPAPAVVPTPAAPVIAANEGPLSYVFGTEKIVSSIELEVLNIEEPKPKQKPEKGGKPKEK